MESMIAFPSSEISKLRNPKQLPFWCNDRGDILRWEGASPLDEWFFLLNDLFIRKNLFSFFDMRGAISLRELNPSTPSYFPKSDFLVYDNLEYFYSALPIVRLRILPSDSGNFLGIISITDALPNYYPEQANSLILLDRDQRIAGFNQTFYELFKPQTLLTRSIIGRPIETLITPTPREIQKKLIGHYEPDAENRFVDHFSHDFLRMDEPPEIRFLGASGRLHRGEGLEWDNPGRETIYLTLFPVVDLGSFDVEICADFVDVKGHAPVIILGSEDQGTPFPYGGMYLAGRSGSREDYVIKREGYVVAEIPSGGNGASAGAYFFSRIGRTLHFGVNNGLLLSYHNPVISSHPLRAVSLGLRPGCGCRIRKIDCRVRPSTAKAPIQDDYMVRLKHAPADSFLLTRFFGPGLGAGDGHVQGYMLQNVTGLQRRFENLEHDYENQVRRGRKLENLLKAYREEEGAFVGNGPTVSGLKAKVRLIAESNATVLIQGETGTGKEVLARYIHDRSPYRSGPFVKVDCSTLPRTLLESELFGHEKGAYTGATERRTGLFERADQGTLFLDEVGNFSRDMQVKLLQFLQDFTVTRVGGTAPIKLNLRVVAATNAPLLDLVRQGVFREDLYYRLFVVVVDLPPLRDRREDIPDLAGHFLKIFEKSLNREAKQFSAAAFRKLLAHRWPGNVRELRNTVQRAVLLSPAEEIGEDDLETILPASGNGPLGPGSDTRGNPLAVRLRVLDDARLRRMIVEYHGNVRRLAAELSVSRRALYYQIKRRGLDLKNLRKGLS